MKVVVTGAAGMVGTALIPVLEKAGHQVLSLVRKKPAGNRGIYWNPETGEIDAASLEGIDAIVHLAGENIASGRWNAERKRKIRDSRVQGTQLIAKTLAGLKKPPKVLACASAIGYYGDRGSEVLREESPPGSGFLADVCKDWEASSAAAAAKGIRVCHLRMGVVLSPEGGALRKMLPPFLLGLGGVMGSGKQYWSWISLEDVAGAFLHCLTNPKIEGAVNGVSPQTVTNREFTKVLGAVLKRPTLFPMPAFAARLAIGEMADALLLSSARVEPARLMMSGYDFVHPDLEGCLRDLLKKRR